MLKWYEETGDNRDVVISSRIRLARNLSSYPFSSKLSKEKSRQIVEELKSKLSGISDGDRKYEYISVNELSDVSKVALVERHLLTENLVIKEEATGALFSEDEAVTVLLNEEDHIRIQALAGGMNLSKAWEAADKMDDRINQLFPYAFDEKLGYLTSFPTNVGTGLRASYMLHLPAVAGTKKLAGIASEIGRFGVTIRGIVGEQGNGIGNLYQIYNQKTLGQTEQEIMKGLDTIAMQLIKQERRIRNKLLQERPVGMEDTLLRSYGVLKYCKTLDIEEGMNLLSDIQFGISSGILKVDSEDQTAIYPLMMGIQPAHLQKRADKPLNEEERDRYRAEYVRNHLPELI